MIVLEIKPHRNGWKVFEAPARELGQAGRLDYVNFGTYVPRI